MRERVIYLIFQLQITLLNDAWFCSLHSIKHGCRDDGAASRLSCLFWGIKGIISIIIIIIVKHEAIGICFLGSCLGWGRWFWLCNFYLLLLLLLALTMLLLHLFRILYLRIWRWLLIIAIEVVDGHGWLIIELLTALWLLLLAGEVVEEGGGGVGVQGSH